MTEHKKQALTYAITAEAEPRIRKHVDSVNKKTGVPKQKIVSDLILVGIKVEK